MRLQYTYIIIGTLILILTLILTFVYFSVFAAANETFTPNTNGIELVVARYNENLEWLKEEPFYKYPVTVYNSGDDDFYKPENMTIVKVDNLGKEAYSYIYHAIHRYDSLSDITVFLPGSTNSAHKFETAKKQIYEVEKHRNTVFISSGFNNVKNDLYDFQVDDWCSTSAENVKKNAECKMYLSDVRPFGKWYENTFGDVHTKHVNYFGLLGIKREHIIQKPKEHYATLLTLFKNPNDEIGHYFERSWEAVFHPMDDAVFIPQF